MPQICPKCSYLRKETDTCPEWQCPACQVVYRKFGNTELIDIARDKSTKTSHRTGRRISTASRWKWLLLFSVIVGVTWQNKLAWKNKSVPGVTQNSTQALGQPEIILYGTSWCGYCAAAREFFKINGIHYTDLDVEKTSEGYEGHKKLGGGGVPLIVIGGETIHGYNESGLRQTLAPWMQSSK